MSHQHYYQTLGQLLQVSDVERRTVVCGAHTGSEALFQNGTLVASLGSATDGWDSDEVLREQLSSPLEVVIFGGGHVGLELAHLCVRLGLRHTIVDDRVEFCNRERFGEATLLCLPFEEVFAQDRGWNRPIFIIVTRGHDHDRLCLEHCLAMNHRYLGMIGSRTKVAQTFAHLKDRGFSPSQLDTVHAPIGLKIGAVTASEIALSIMAEVVSSYRSGAQQVVRLDSALLALQAHNRHIAVRVIGKSGSAPAEVGFTLALFEDGSTAGTIGGGVVEALAIEEAKWMASDGSIVDHTTHFDLSAGEAASIGMVCGGKIEVLFQRR